MLCLCSAPALRVTPPGCCGYFLGLKTVYPHGYRRVQSAVKNSVTTAD